MSQRQVLMHQKNGGSYQDVFIKNRAKKDSLYIYETESEKSAKVPMTQMKLYVLLASMLWLATGILILVSAKRKEQVLKEHNSHEECCFCLEYANNACNTDGVKVEWSQCRGKTCNGTMYDADTLRQDKCVSTTTWKWLKKNYTLYGVIALVVCVAQIAILLLYLSLIKDPSVGVSIFIHSIVSLEICYYALFKCYQYYKEKMTWQGTSQYCFVDALSLDEEDYTDKTIMTFIGIHVFVQVTSMVFATCCRSVNITRCLACTACRHYWFTVTSIMWVICIILAFVNYFMITSKIVEASGPGRLAPKDRVILIAAAAAIFVQLFLIFAFPFCRNYAKTICQTWKCYFLCPGNKSTAVISSSDKIITPYNQLIDVELNQPQQV